MAIIFEIDEAGNLHGLYTDRINLFAVGQIVDVRKASNVEFNEIEQVWEVLSLNGKVLHKHPNRNMAIGWEVEHFSPGEMYYDPMG